MTFYYNYNIEKLEDVAVGDNPSKLKRAGVPIELIKKYTDARDMFRGPTDPSDDKQKKQYIEHEKAFRNVEKELRNELHRINFRTLGEVDMTIVGKLIFHSEIAAYKIEKETGISRNTILKLRNGESDLLNIPTINAIKLTELAERMEKE